MNELKEFRRNTPAMTDNAATAAKARLMTAIHEPEAARKSATSGARRFGWRIAVAAALALVVGGTVVTLRDQQDMATVASVTELGERAAGAAENDPTPAPGPAQWLYTKELQLDGVEADVDRDRHATWERWTSVDGKRSAWYQGGKLMFQGSAVFDPAALANAPVTPAGVIARIKAAILDEDRRGPQELNGQVPPQILFMEINQLISEQWLAPEVRAALFRALPTIKGITMTEDVPVADGRRGVAFSLDDDGARQSLVLDPQTFRYLGTNSTRLQDRTHERADGSKETFKAGTVSLTAQLEAAIVNQPGQRS
ncbi:CU044_5270 family protein [Microtetraspora malaysiensis]|uniref:CU044_5270 family protein n=1 Tax=Microtetraspora malaysiensis TaxID=161358 RepID=UPI0008311A99|nr:CU044_5270 family protein [Microtetraspora malaysiensis]